MNKISFMKPIRAILLFFIFFHSDICSNAQRIDRQALVKRHTIINRSFDSLSSLSIGNGRFAFTVDATGLQSFPAYYAGGVPLGTQSEWGWHSYVNKEQYRFDETLKDYTLNGGRVSYSVQLKEPPRGVNAVNWFRQNPHRLQLANLGFEMQRKDGTPIEIAGISDIKQELVMWTGEIHSRFTVDGESVEVWTYCHPAQDAISVRVKSRLLKNGQIKIRLRFPYPTGEWKDVGDNWTHDDDHQSGISRSTKQSATFHHTLDSSRYFANLTWEGAASVSKKQSHYFLLTPGSGNEFKFTCRFTERNQVNPVPSFSATSIASMGYWKGFWQKGGAIDFSGSIDQRATELERRIIVSQWLTAIQCAGNFPPQETGLTYNSWFGKPHLEMHWWHGVHFALWGRIELLEKSLGWYAKVAARAKALAKRQGYEGLRWQKMVSHEGDESPSSVGAFLVWQQPHYIYFAELCYREKGKQTLSKYKNLVWATADFMASYAHYDTATKKYILGKGLIPAQERFRAEETYNPTYELTYWHWALNIAQEWRLRLGLSRNKKWDDVIKKLSPLPVQDKKYLFTESGTDSYTNPEYRTDHPSVLGAWGMLPKTTMVDESTMKNTFDWIWKNWSWNETWGWDFPMTAMTATRLGMPEKAIDALLMPIQTNTYLNNGHNYQDGRLTIYLPGNGGLLIAAAMMCAGFDGSPVTNPGIPAKGWKVKWEGLRKMP
jgi:hypothetical protein